MKKYILTQFCFLLLLSTAYSQQMYYDALKLRSYVLAGQTQFAIDNAARQEIATILRNYSSDLVRVSPASTVATVMHEFDNNPFLKPYIPVGYYSGGAAGISSSLISAIGGINISNFSDGLAKVLVKRFKEELTVSFFRKFKEKIESSKELQTLFPQTHNVLKTVDKDIYQFSLYINSLREAFVKDLSNLYTNFKRAEQLPTIKKFLEDSSHIAEKTIVVNSFYFIEKYSNDVHPGEALASYDPEANLFFTDANLQLNIRSSVRVLQLVSESFRSQSKDTYWVPADSVKQLLEDPIGRDMYFGLLYQKGNTVQYTFHTNTSNLTLTQLLNTAYSTATQIDEYKKQFEEIIDRAQEVNEYINSLKEKKKSEIDYNDYYKLFNASLDILEKGLEFTKLAPVNIDSALQNQIVLQAEKWIKTARTTGELYVDVRTKNYSSAVMNTLSLLDAIFESNPSNISGLKENLLQYGSFAANVAQAKTSDDVEKAIDAAILPVGSSSIKRETKVNISLNAYLGPYAGYEYLPKLKENKWAFSSGLTAPVGVAFSWGNKHFLDDKKNPGGKSITIFVPIIDIGAMAAFRFTDDSSKVASEVKLENIISPGLYFYYGFGKCPISIGFGGQLGPQLREVTAKDVNIDKNYYFRFGLNLVVDIPFFNFYTKN